MPTLRQKAAFEKILEKPRSIGSVMREVGYSENTIVDPKNLTESKGFLELMDEHGMNDEELAEVHRKSLNSTRIDHMVFPLGPKEHTEEKDEHLLSDTDIIKYLEEVNCTVRRIVHGETGRHVYFWVANDKSRLVALDMAYKVKGKYAPEKRFVLSLDMQMTPREKKLAEEYEEELKKSILT